MQILDILQPVCNYHFIFAILQKYLKSKEYRNSNAISKTLGLQCVHMYFAATEFNKLAIMAIRVNFNYVTVQLHPNIICLMYFFYCFLQMNLIINDRPCSRGIISLVAILLLNQISIHSVVKGKYS